MNLALILVLGGIGVFIGGIWLFHAVFRKFNSDNWGTFLFIVWFFALFFTGMTTFTNYENSIKYQEEKVEYYIQSLGNNSYVEGDIGLFTGSIEEIDYYFFYVSYMSGMGREKLRTSECYIVEGNYSRPIIKGMYTKYKDNDRFWKIWDEYKPDYYKIYVPKNTIIRDFKVR